MEHVYLTHTVECESTVKDILINKLGISSRLLRKLKLNKRIFCNGKEAWVNDSVAAGDVISTDITFEEKEARKKLMHCGLFNGIDDKDSLIDAIIKSDANQLKSAVDIVNMIKNDDIKMYQDMEDAYKASKNKKSDSVGIHL